MHGSTRERLEELLGAQGVAAGDRETAHHLASCSECATELEALRDHDWLTLLLAAVFRFILPPTCVSLKAPAGLV